MDQNKTASQKQGKKLLLILPLLALPFLALFFWAMGGGKGHRTTLNEKQAGLNAILPDAQLPDDSAMDKMGFYEQEEKGGRRVDDDTSNQGTAGILEGMAVQDPTMKNGVNPYENNPYAAPSATGWANNPTYSEQAIRQKMAELEAGMRESEKSPPSQSSSDITNLYTDDSPKKQLTGLPATSTDPEAPDPEMNQLQNMMDRIYDIQHPEEVANRLQQQSVANRGVVFPVGVVPTPETVHFLSATGRDLDSTEVMAKRRKANGFFGLAAYNSTLQTVDQGIIAIIQDNTTVVNGASIRLRLLQDVYINGIHIPAGNFLTGEAQLSNDRIGIVIRTILYNQNILPVKLSAYDTDGMEGLYVPGSINREVIKQSGDNAIQGVGVGTLDPSIGAQAAAAGIETAKTLFSRKLKLSKVFIKAGHRIILKDNQ